MRMLNWINQRGRIDRDAEKRIEAGIYEPNVLSVTDFVRSWIDGGSNDIGSANPDADINYGPGQKSCVKDAGADSQDCQKWSAT